jgi:hypothetical protein
MKWTQRAVSQGVNRLECGAENSLATIAKVKKNVDLNTIQPYVFMA